MDLKDSYYQWPGKTSSIVQNIVLEVQSPKTCKTGLFPLIIIYLTYGCSTYHYVSCSCPNICFLFSFTTISSVFASFHRPWFLYMNTRFPMLVSVSGCSSPNACFVFSITTISSASASFHQPWFLYVDARFPMLISVSGCSSPNACFVFSITNTSSGSAFFHWPH